MEITSEMLEQHEKWLRGENDGERIDLSDADLSGADLSGADLSDAYLSGAILSGANLPAPSMILLAQWGKLSDDLTRLCMRHDAANHDDPAAFSRWASGGDCPYAKKKFQRCINFAERSDLWADDLLATPVPTAFELMKLLIREKCADSDYH